MRRSFITRRNPMNFSALFLLFLTLLSAGAGHAAPPVKARDIRPDRELLITHPSVVDSETAKYPGAWSFGALIEQLVGKEKAPDVVRRWLESYYWNGLPDCPDAMPTFTDPSFISLVVQMQGKPVIPKMDTGVASWIPGRPGVFEKVIRPWMARDGYDPTAGKPWQPNLKNAPFRLLGIVNRMDLVAPQLVDLEKPLENRWKLAGREKDFARMKALMTDEAPIVDRRLQRFGGLGGYGGGFTNSGPTDAGEGRLIFGAVDGDGRPLAGDWTLIFEYKLAVPNVLGASTKRKGDDPVTVAVSVWAELWHRLGSFELGDHRFNEALENLTTVFTNRPQPADPTSFAQLRSSEASFGFGREFRQFELRDDKLVPTFLPMTPSPRYMADTRSGGQLLSSFLRSIQPLILAGFHTLPDKVEDRGDEQQLLGGRALIPDGERDFYWDPNPRVSREARRIFSMNTCNGCHAGDTGCPDGLHVHPRAHGEAAKLSGFLRMDGRPNRFQDPGLKTSYVQQREMEDRAEILAALLLPKESRRLDALEDVLRERMRRGH